MDLFAPLEQQETLHREEQRELRRQEAVLRIQHKYGKNAILKGMNFREGATTIARNGQVGGHKR
jgi:DNA polymerase V